MAGLASIFLDVLLAPAPRPQIPDDELSAQLLALWERARQTWPGLELSVEDYVSHLAHVLSLPDNADQSLASLHTDDLYLARACASGDPTAIAVCEQRFSDVIDRALAQQGVDDATRDDLKQSLREWLFVAGQRPAQIVTYQGRGRLAGWLKVIVVRRALKSFRGKHRTRPIEDEELLPDRPELAGTDPEQQLSKLLFRSEFKEAFREAVATLAADERQLLARSVIEGASIDVLGQELGVHRSTAARRLEKARRNLFFAIRRMIMQRHHLDAAGYDSVLGLVQSQLDLSVRLLLGGQAPSSI